MRILFAIVTLALALPAIAPAQSVSDRSRIANAIAVIVNDAIVTYSDIEQFIAPAVEVLRRTYSRDRKQLDEQLDKAFQDGTEQLVERQLILGDWKTGGFNLPEKILEEEVNDRIKERYGDRLKLAQSLHSEGMTLEAFRNQIRDDFIVNILRAKNAGSQQIIISPQKIESYYVENKDKFQAPDRVKLRIIAITQKPALPGSAKKLLEEIRGKIKEGTSFAEMASLYSEDSYRGQGGERSWEERSGLRAEIADVAFKLKAGELSEIIETPDTCYLVLAEQVSTAHIQPLSEVRDLIERELLTKERTRLQKKYIEKLKAKSFVRYF
ncbi:MAG TPA: peptidyl-prolyl cis-trans isomerase [Verrucomicrobiae bacterium]|jgi:peptidyl-prolyl cis-trans isomerase SurA